MAQPREKRKLDRLSLIIGQPSDFLLEEVAEIGRRHVRVRPISQPGTRLMRDVILETLPRPRISLATTCSVDCTPPRNGDDPAKWLAEFRRVMRRLAPDLK